MDASYLALSDDGGENPIESTIANLQQLGLTWERSLFSTEGVIDLKEFLDINGVEVEMRHSQTSYSIKSLSHPLPKSRI